MATCDPLAPGPFKPVECLLGGIINWITGGMAAALKGLIEVIAGIGTPNVPSGALLWAEPSGNGYWHKVWEATWIGSGEPWMLGFALVVLVIGVYARSTLNIFAGQQQVTARLRKRKLREGFVLLLACYPIVVGWLILVDAMAQFLLPTHAQFKSAMGSLLGAGIGTAGKAAVIQSGTVAVSGTSTGGIILFIPILVTAIGAALLYLLFAMQAVLLKIYAFALPVGIAFSYSGIPYVSDIAQDLSMRFVPLSLMPLPIAFIAQGYVFLFGGGSVTAMGGIGAGLLGFILPAVFVLIALLVSWKLLTEGSTLVGYALWGAAGLATAGTLYASGASSYAIASAARGRVARGALYGIAETDLALPAAASFAHPEIEIRNHRNVPNDGEDEFIWGEDR